MNDDELITAVRESVADVRMDVAAEQIAARSRAIRARRRIPAVAGGLALVTGAALAVPALLPGSGAPAGHPAGARLTAWTVTRHDGSVRVALHELREPAGLQRKLRADGVPASVTFANKPTPACHGYPGSGTQQQRRHRLGSVASIPAGHPNVLVIHPAALPSGAGLGISAQFLHDSSPHRLLGFSVRMVQAAPGCTGS